MHEMQDCSAVSDSNQYSCCNKILQKRIQKATKDKNSGCNNEQTISCLPMHDDVPKIYIDEFVDPRISYFGEVLCMTRKNEIFTINERICKKYNNSGVFLLQLHGELIKNPIDIATWNNGMILLSDSGNEIGDGKILLFKANGHFLRVLVSDLSSPVGIATDQDSNVYICDRIDNCVLKFNEFGFLVTVLKLFNTPTFIAIGPCRSIIVSDADGIYCIDKYSELIWKHNLITGCKFGVLPCGCAVVDHAPKREASDPDISIIGRNITTVAKSILGTSGIYIDSENVVWIGVASKRYFRQMFISHLGNTCLSSKMFTSKKRSGKTFLSKVAKSTSIDHVDHLPLTRGIRISFNKDILFDVVCDQRLNDAYRKWIDAHRMKGRPIHTCCSQFNRTYSFDEILSLSSILDCYMYSGTTFLSQRAMEDIILHDVVLDSPSSLDNALLSIVDCKTNVVNIMIVHNLLQNGANVNAKDFAGNTALHKAVMCEKILHVRLLLAFGADPSAINERGDSPISLAVLYSQHECVKAMLWCLSRLFMQNHKTISAWPGYNQETLNSFKTSRRCQTMIDSEFLSHLKNQRDISLQMLKHTNWLKKKDSLENNHGLYIVSQVNRNFLKKNNTFRGITVIWRNELDLCKEAKVLASEGVLQVMSVSDEVAEKISSVLKEEAPKLLANHSNLTMISPSGVKSSGFKCKHKTFPTICIGFYCKVKGIIPLGESPFPKYVGPFQTDVREGYFTFGNGPKGPNEYHDNLKIGCCIAADNGNSSGTLGGFVEIDKEDYLVTAAHVLFDCRALQLGLSSYLKFSPVHVLQPTRSSGNNGSRCHPVGKVTKAVFSHGCHKDVSVDAALIRITDINRAPVDGSVPAEKLEKIRAAGYDMENLPVFETGQILENIGESERRNDVVKYGAESGLTRGSLNVDGSYVRIESKELRKVEKDLFGNLKENVFTMYQQREVMNIGDRNFFELGDSGAFVFMLFQDKKPKCVGMAIGKTSYGSCILTPIGSVLDKLGLKAPLRLKSFSQPYTVLPNSPQLRNSPSPKIKRKKKRSEKSKNEDKPFSGFRLDSNTLSPEVLKSMDEKLTGKLDEMDGQYDRRISRIENSVSEMKQLFENFIQKSSPVKTDFQTPRKVDSGPKRILGEHSYSSSVPAKKVCTFSPAMLAPDTPNDGDYEFDISSVELNTPKSNSDFS